MPSKLLVGQRRNNNGNKRIRVGVLISIRAEKWCGCWKRTWSSWSFRFCFKMKDIVLRYYMY